jgi:pimeloyl-ACP methyl ester carboxylesterase
MSLFALVHGGAHGGWCWELVVPMLEQRGHTVVAPDLPLEEPDAGAVRWAETVADAIDGAPTPHDRDVVVVGHSMSGMALPVVPTLRSVRRLVFLGAMVPVPGCRYIDYLATEPGAVTFDPTPRPDDEVGPSGMTWLAAREGFYQDCPEDLARAAWKRLRTQTQTVFTEDCPFDTWPDVPTTYILMTEDRAVNPAWSRRAAARIGADLIELGGDHSPFYSRPEELTEVLSGL